MIQGRAAAILGHVRQMLLAAAVASAAAQHVPVRWPAADVPAVREAAAALRQWRDPARPPLQACYSETLASNFAREALAANPESGVTKALVRFYPGNYAAFYAELDVGRAARYRPRWSRHIPATFLRGRRSVQVDLRFLAENGRLKARVEKALLDGVRVPSVLTQLSLRSAARFRDGRFNVFQGVTIPYGVQRAYTLPGQVCAQR
jgi:hypothetical protein